MDVYMYQADLYCEECGEAIRKELSAKKEQPEDPEDETTYDSDEYPKGPYSDGGGEADCPWHCGGCRVFLENPLTSDGIDYVREATSGESLTDTEKQWAEFYQEELS